MTVRPGKKFGFQSAVENLQRRRRPDRLHRLFQTDAAVAGKVRLIAHRNGLPICQWSPIHVWTGLGIDYLCWCNQWHYRL